MRPRPLLPVWLVALLAGSGHIAMPLLSPPVGGASYPTPTGGDGSRRARRKAAKRRNKARAKWR